MLWQGTDHAVMSCCHSMESSVSKLARSVCTDKEEHDLPPPFGLHKVPEEEVFSHLVTVPDDGGPRRERNASNRGEAATRDSSTAVDSVVPQASLPSMACLRSV